MWKIKNYVFIISVLILFTAMVPVYGLESTPLTLEQAKKAAVEYYGVNDKLQWYERDWKDKQQDMRQMLDFSDQILEIDDKLIKIKKYLDNDDYLSMRKDLKRDEALDYLLMRNRITVIEYVFAKHDENEPVFYYYNDDEFLREYYRFQYDSLSGMKLSNKDRVDMLLSKDATRGQIDLLIKQQKAEIESENAKIEIDTYKAYTDIIIARQTLKNCEDKLEETQKLMNKYEEQYKLGMVSRIEYSEAQAELEAETNEYHRALRNLEKCNMTLKLTMGINANDPVNIVTNIELPEIGQLNSQEWMKKFESENIKLFAIIEGRVNLAREKYDIAAKELEKSDKLLVEIQEDLEKAEYEQETFYRAMETAIVQQLRGLRSTGIAKKELEKNVELMGLKIDLLESQHGAGYVSELEVLKVKNIYSTLITSLENLKYTEAYQWESLQYTVKY